MKSCEDCLQFDKKDYYCTFEMLVIADPKKPPCHGASWTGDPDVRDFRELRRKTITALEIPDVKLLPITFRKGV